MQREKIPGVDWSQYDMLPVGIIVIRKDYSILFWNTCIADWSGLPASGMTGTNLLERFPELNRNVIRGRIDLVFDRGPAAIFSPQFHPHFIPAIHPDGGQRFQSTTVVPHEAGKDLNAMIVIEDVTDLYHQTRKYRNLKNVAEKELGERKKAEAAFRQLRADHTAIIEHVPAMIFYKDTKNNFIRVNPAGARAFGFPPDGIEGKSCYDLFPDLAEKYYQDDLEVIRSGKPKLGIIEPMITASGEHLWVQTDKIPLTDAQGSVTGILLFVLDITERRRGEEALARASKKLNLLSGITRHDILNQIMALNAYISLSEDAINDPVELKEYFTREEKIAEIIAEQISFTRDYEDLGVKAPVWQNIHAVIGRVILQFPKRNFRIDAEDFGREVFADPMMEKVFYNLIDNALRYGGEKMTFIRLTCREEKGVLVIVVEDDGNGISCEDKKQLFTKGFGKHTGLGLFLSLEILSLTGIDITETGEPGKGARFEITVPEGMWRKSGESK